MKRRLIRLGIALAIYVAMCAGCVGRQHTQHEGTYQFTAQEILRDDCGLQRGSSVLWTGTMQISGDLTRMRLDDRLYGMEAYGYFLYGVEKFILDGSAPGVTTQVNGTDCQIGLVQFHIDATTDSARDFHGMGDVVFRTNQAGCFCELTARFTASML